jgi:hypothetical protein
MTNTTVSIIIALIIAATVFYVLIADTKSTAEKLGKIVPAIA